MTICRSIDFSRATASAICKSSSLLALTAILLLLFRHRARRLLARRACARLGPARFGLFEFRCDAGRKNRLRFGVARRRNGRVRAPAPAQRLRRRRSPPRLRLRPAPPWPPAAIRGSRPRSEPAWPRRCRAAAGRLNRLSGLGVAAQKLERRRKSLALDGANHAAKPLAAVEPGAQFDARLLPYARDASRTRAPAAGRCRAKKSPADRPDARRPRRREPATRPR